MSSSTNGASLEDCHTNIFSLIDLNGIRWKRFKAKENYLYNPIDTHPATISYAKCLTADLLCVWRQEPQKFQLRHQTTNNQDQQDQNHNSSNLPPPPPPAVNNRQQQTNYELWVFGYSNQFKLEGIIGDDLIEVEDGSWDLGLSYECRTLLFKALHNSIERCLLSKGFTRVGRWFVQPSSDNTTLIEQEKQHQDQPDNHKRSKNDRTPIDSRKSTSVTSTLSRIINIFVSNNYAEKSEGLRHNSIRSSSSCFTSAVDGSKSSLSFAFNFFIHGDSTICASVDVRQHPLIYPLTKADLQAAQDGAIVRVILSPYGLNGILNGISHKDSDNGSPTTMFVQQWSRFYPLPHTLSRLVKTTPKTGAIPTPMNNIHPSNPFLSSDPHSGPPSFYPGLPILSGSNSHQSGFYLNYDVDEVPPVVEVLVAGVRMRYPSECVFIGQKCDYPLQSTGDKCSELSSKRSHNDTNFEPDMKLQSTVKNETITNKNFQTSTALISPLKEEHKIDTPKIKPEIDSIKHTNSIENTKTGSSVPYNQIKQQTDKPDTDQNGFIDMDNNVINAPGTALSRFGIKPTSSSTGTNSISLGVTDLVRLFPTPPSLEQIAQSPATLIEEIGIRDPKSVLSPVNISQLESSKDNSGYVYKPEVLSYVVPTIKWAPLPNMPSSPTKQLPPECVYRSSSSTKGWLGSSNSNSKAHLQLPLMDQTNKNGSLHAKLTKFATNETTTSNSVSTKVSNSKSVIKPTGYSHIEANTCFRNIPSQAEAASPSASSFIANSPASGNPRSVLGGQTPIRSPGIASFASSGQANLATLDRNRMTRPLLNSNITTGPIGSPAARPISSSASNNVNTNKLSLDSPEITTVCTSTVMPLTLPHQRLFNNLSEISSIHLNLILSDTVLNMFRDHNFESCNICVCNMTVRGTSSDSIQNISNIKSFNFQPQAQLESNTVQIEENINDCTCGFSATINRHFSHLTGLFYEDELELTSILYEPCDGLESSKSFRHTRLSTYPEKKEKTLKTPQDSLSNAEKTEPISEENDRPISQAKTNIKQDELATSSLQQFSATLTATKLFVIDQIRQHCSTAFHSSSSLNRILLIEYFRNNKLPSGCQNYYAKKSTSMIPSSVTGHKNNLFLTRVSDRNPLSLIFGDYCELTKSIINVLLNQQAPGSSPSNVVALRTLCDQHASNGLKADQKPPNRNNLLFLGLQALLAPSIAIDPKGAIQLMNQFKQQKCKNHLPAISKALQIFSSPLHEWQFRYAPIPENNFNTANLLRLVQPLLDESIGSHNKKYNEFLHQQQQNHYSSRDAPPPTPPCQGPLTWRQFHRFAGRGTEDQCEPQPIPSLLIGHHVERNLVAISPFALKFWEKLLLEPYAPAHNISYVVVAPENPYILSHTKYLFKELSNTYELLKLGKHNPITHIINDGVLRVGKSTVDKLSNEKQDEWFETFDSSCEDEKNAEVLTKLKQYSLACRLLLAKIITENFAEKMSQYDPHASRFNSTNLSENAQQQSNKPFQSSSVAPPSNHMTNQEPTKTDYNPNDQSHNNPRSHTLINPHGTTGPNDDAGNDEDSSRQVSIVVYIVDPFSLPSTDQNRRTLATVGLMRCYSQMLQLLPDNLRQITQLQLISLDSVLNHSRPVDNSSRVDQLKSLALNVFSQSRKVLANQSTAKSLTGFGPAAALDSFFKKKNQQLCTTKMYTPPFILAPMKDKQTELSEMFGDRREKSSVLYCSYCVTEDQKWLVASCTNDKGEISETTVININLLQRSKRRTASVRRFALCKLMEFIVSVMSEWFNPWRLVIGRLGRLGHGELKDWASLLSKRSLQEYSRRLTKMCNQCMIMPTSETISILSACLVSLEPDSQMRVMPDQFTNDDRLASFNKCPLSTPEDTSATHILVFPTSASMQSAQNNLEDQGSAGLDEEDLNFPIEDGIVDGLDGENMDDLFSGDDLLWGNPNPIVVDNLTNNDPLMGNGNSNILAGSSGGNLGGQDMGGQFGQDESFQLLQQPLALGYYVSTAKTGPLPNWFWARSPQLRETLPVFLKSALLIHLPSVQHSDDLLHSGSTNRNKNHRLDSHLTTDVLRYVLEGYNSLSWLALDPKTHDRQSCLPVHIQNLMQLYHTMRFLS